MFFKTGCHRVIEMCKDIYNKSRREKIRIDFNYQINPECIHRTVNAIDVTFVQNLICYSLIY